MKSDRTHILTFRVYGKPQPAGSKRSYVPLDRQNKEPSRVRTFAAGFITGQAEKIHLGACSAAMFRPGPDYLPDVKEIAGDVARRYGLLWCPLDTSRGVEVWLCGDEDVRSMVLDLHRVEENSPTWHGRRGMLCGVPLKAVDYRFHEREGYGEACDG